MTNPKARLQNPRVPVPAKQASNGAAYEAIDDYIGKQMQRLNMPGVSFAIVEGDEIVHLRGFGRARPGGEAPSARTPFPIASLNKSFIALAVMQLVEAGKIELDAPVQRYLPWFRVADPRASAQITVRHLLLQTSGLTTSSGEFFAVDFNDSPGAIERQARRLSTQALSRPAGSQYEYSNSNYILLGLIIETASGEPYPDYIQSHIFNPLGMSHSYTSQAAAKQNGLAVGHQYWFTIPVAVPDMPTPPGSLLSSAEDLAHYLIAHLNRGRFGEVQILSTSGMDELHRGAVDFSIDGLGPIVRILAKGIPLGQYGMGWNVDKIGGTNLVWHGGTLPDFFAFMALLPEQNKGFVLLFNACNHWFNPVLTDVGLGAAALLAGEKPASPPFFKMIPWMLRGQLLIPVLQLAGVAATIQQLRRWRLDPQHRPSSRRKWGEHILLPLIPNLLIALTLKPMLSNRRGYLKLYMPDFSLIAMVCGSFALVWSFLRTGLVLGAMRKNKA